MGLWTIGYNGAGQFALGYASIDQAIAKVRSRRDSPPQRIWILIEGFSHFVLVWQYSSLLRWFTNTQMDSLESKY